MEYNMHKGRDREWHIWICLFGKMYQLERLVYQTNSTLEKIRFGEVTDVTSPSPS